MVHISGSCTSLYKRPW